MATKTRGSSVHVYHDDATWVSVQSPTRDDLDTPLIPNPALMLYAEMKLSAVAPWLVRSTSYQSALEEAYHLCHSGYDFNLIVYEQPTGHYVDCYEPAPPTSQANHHSRAKKKRGWRRFLRRVLRTSPHQVRPKYRDEVLMAPGKPKWIEVDAGRFIVVPEGILRCNAAGFAL